MKHEYSEPEVLSIDFWEHYQYEPIPEDFTVVVSGSEAYRKKLKLQLQFVFGDKVRVEEHER